MKKLEKEKRGKKLKEKANPENGGEMREEEKEKEGSAAEERRGEEKILVEIEECFDLSKKRREGEKRKGEKTNREAKEKERDKTSY